MVDDSFSESRIILLAVGLLVVVVILLVAWGIAARNARRKCALSGTDHPLAMALQEKLQLHIHDLHSFAGQQLLDSVRMLEAECVAQNVVYYGGRLFEQLSPSELINFAEELSQAIRLLVAMKRRCSGFCALWFLFPRTLVGCGYVSSFDWQRLQQRAACIVSRTQEIIGANSCGDSSRRRMFTSESAGASSSFSMLTAPVADNETRARGLQAQLLNNDVSASTIPHIVIHEPSQHRVIQLNTPPLISSEVMPADGLHADLHATAGLAPPLHDYARPFLTYAAPVQRGGTAINRSPAPSPVPYLYSSSL